MKSHEENFGYPFAFIAGQGLGYSVESMRTPVPLKERLLGRSKLHYLVNTATGNLIAKDRIISIPDINKPIEFSYLYNNLAEGPAKAWRFHAGESHAYKSCRHQNTNPLEQYG